MSRARKIPLLQSADTREFSPRVIRALMHMRAVTLGRGNAAEAPLFPFRPEEVLLLHFRQRGGTRGVWFRLKDGRVFDAWGRPAESDPACYVTLH